MAEVDSLCWKSNLGMALVGADHPLEMNGEVLRLLFEVSCLFDFTNLTTSPIFSVPPNIRTLVVINDLSARKCVQTSPERSLATARDIHVQAQEVSYGLIFMTACRTAELGLMSNVHRETPVDLLPVSSFRHRMFF